MDDSQIIDLYWSRSEAAITETDQKYGKYCYSIAYNILVNNEDAEESVSETDMAAWKSMPSKRPSILATFLGKITRHLSVDRWRSHNRYKRGGGEIVLVLEELEDCATEDQTVAKALEGKYLALLINRFLKDLPETEKKIFLCRYWYLDSISDIANYYGFSESKVASMLYRTRKRLRAVLERGGAAMNSNDILDMIGDAKDIYIWDAQKFTVAMLLTITRKYLLRRCG